MMLVVVMNHTRKRSKCSVEAVAGHTGQGVGWDWRRVLGIYPCPPSSARKKQWGAYMGSG